MTALYKPWAPFLLATACYVLGGAVSFWIQGPPEKFVFYYWLHPLVILFASVPFVLLRTSNLKRKHSDRANAVGQSFLLALGIGAYYYLFTCLDEDPLSVFGFMMFPLYLSVVATGIFLVTRMLSGPQGPSSE